MPVSTESPRKVAERRVAELRVERSSWVPHWRELSEYQQPRLGRFLMSDVNKGGKRHQSILDSEALFSHRVLRAGMLAGTSSPARPWFRFGLPDKDLMEYAPVKQWLHDCATIVLAIFSESNTYQALSHYFGEMGLFGTAAGVVLKNFNNVIHHYPATAGEYCLGLDAEGNVNTYSREMSMTVGQLVQRFGLKKCSRSVQDLWSNGNFDKWIDVAHLIEPRSWYDRSKLDAKNMPYKSVYFEWGRDTHDEFLSESGFRMFRALGPRWDVVGNDVYGHAPGMEVLGGTKQLQHEQLRKGQGIDYKTNPPIQVPTALKGQAANRLPGGVTYYDSSGPSNGVRPLYEVNLDLNELREDIQDVRRGISRGYYTDLFLMIANDDRLQRATATEIAERKEEKLLMLGPTLEHTHRELHTPMIDIAFADAQEARILPPPPPELNGQTLEIRYISVLAQAQRMIAAGGVDRLLGTVGSMVNVWPEARHKVRALRTVDEYADIFGVNPELVVPDDEAIAAAEAERQQQATAQMAATAPDVASAAKSASEVDVDNLRDIMRGLQGYGTTPDLTGAGMPARR